MKGVKLNLKLRILKTIDINELSDIIQRLSNLVQED